jgi:hypothetical protein
LAGVAGRNQGDLFVDNDVFADRGLHGGVVEVATHLGDLQAVGHPEAGGTLVDEVLHAGLDGPGRRTDGGEHAGVGEPARPDAVTTNERNALAVRVVGVLVQAEHVGIPREGQDVVFLDHSLHDRQTRDRVGAIVGDDQFHRVSVQTAAGVLPRHPRRKRVLDPNLQRPSTPL